MTLFLVRRIMQGTIIIFTMSIIVFLGVYAIGNPVEILINPDATPEIKQRAIEKLGLDKPVLEQYGYFVVRAFQGDLGNSFIYDEPALKLILAAMPATLELAICSLVLALLIGIPLGMIANPDLIALSTVPTAALVTALKVGASLALISHGVIAPRHPLMKTTLIAVGAVVLFWPLAPGSLSP